jgi:hypothetical protein
MDKTKASPTRPWLNAQLATMLLPWGGVRSIAAGAKHLIDVCSAGSGVRSLWPHTPGYPSAALAAE